VYIKTKSHFLAGLGWELVPSDSSESSERATMTITTVRVSDRAQQQPWAPGVGDMASL
jgi:hypothetical protein